MNIKSSFIKHSYNENWELYQDALHYRKTVPTWDIFVLTASNESQANAYRIQLKYRKELNLLPKRTKFIVVSDPEGKKIGSGGATINALYKTQQICGSIKNKRVIIIHSGGDSKRIPQYSAFGKLFARVPRELPDGRFSTLFDEFLISLSGLPSRMKEGVFIVSGDVLLLFNHNQLDFGRQGAVGISIKTKAEIGTRHGVYVSNSSSKVEKILQKKTIDFLSKNGAISDHEMVDIDTGLVWFDSEVTHDLLALTSNNELFLNSNEDVKSFRDVCLSLYSDLLIPFTSKTKSQEYLEEPPENENNSGLIKIREKLWSMFKFYSMYVQALSPAEFIHFGTTKEYRDLMIKADKEYKYLSWEKEIVSFKRNKSYVNKPTIINSYLGKDVNLGKDIVIEDSYLNTYCNIGNGSIVSNIYLENLGMTLRENLTIHQLPVIYEGRKGFITRIYGVNDNPKCLINSGEATFMNKGLDSYIKEINLDVSNIWFNNKPKRLWDAKFFPFCEDREESIKMALLLQEPLKMNKKQKQRWINLKRFSLYESYKMADHEIILSQQSEIENIIRVKQFIANILEGMYFKEAKKKLVKNTTQLITRLTVIHEFIESETDFLKKMRLYRALSEILKDVESELEISKETVAASEWNFIKKNFEDASFESINYSIASCVNKKHKNINNIFNNVIVEAAARINFGGGWSDTPPYSIEKGGTVLNAAISIKNTLPISVKIEKIKDFVIECKSEDLNIRKTFNYIDQMMDFQDPSDPLALLKAAFFVIGIINKKKQSLEGLLKEEIGGGVRLTTSVKIPKGSGLGTSSILAGAILRGLNEFLGNRIDDDDLFDQVLYLEQILTTGGGWQDQVGGLTRGIKLITSKPGIPQQLKCEQLQLDKNTLRDLNNRLVIIYTGQRRLAKRILREIMSKYILNDPNTLSYLKEMQKIAILMKFELEKGNLNNFAELMNQHWEINKKLDPGCTNSYIDQIFQICRPYISSGKICGAGGGGFIQVLLKDSSMKVGLQNKLKSIFQDNNIGIWDSNIVNRAVYLKKQ